MDPDESLWKGIERHLRHVIDDYNKEQRQVKGNIRCLFSLAVGATLQNLEDAEDIGVATLQMLEKYDFFELRDILKSPRATYRLLRAFHDVKLYNGRCAIDLDEAILENEHYLLHRAVFEGANGDGKYLVGLEDSVKMLPNKTFSSPDVVSFVRKDPPIGGLEVLDDLRKRTEKILSSNAAFSQKFDEITGGVLRGLDWSNVLLAGDLASFTLLHTDPVGELTSTTNYPSLDLFIHGLDADGANRKVEEIYELWNDHLPASLDRVVLKTPHMLTYRSAGPGFVIRIRLKLYPSPTDMLLCLDLDPSAIAYDGSSVFMLPRCARAIETGYTTFTNELVYGHIKDPSGRPATTPTRLAQYARQGFGLRFLPAFAKLLQADPFGEGRLKFQDSWVQRYRYPWGSVEPGLMTLKRIAYLGREHVRRLHYGLSEVVNPCIQYLNDSTDEGSFRWNELCEVDETLIAELKALNENSRFAGDRLFGPVISESDLANEVIRRDLKLGFSSFEAFSRFCEAWRSNTRRETRFEWCQTEFVNIDFEYDPFPLTNTLHGLLGANSESPPSSFIEFCDASNTTLFSSMASAISMRLLNSDGWSRSDFRDYLTRRIRKLICGDDFREVHEKQITLPILISHELEKFVVQLLEQYDPNGTIMSISSQQPLIPVHDTATHDATSSTLPSLRDNTGEAGNFRYWVITSASQWGGQHKVIDEVREVLWALHTAFDMLVRDSMNSEDGMMRSRDCVTATKLFDSMSSSKQIHGAGPRDLAFRRWVYPTIDSIWTPGGKTEGEDVTFPFSNDCFWNKGDEGEWDDWEDGVPEWREVAADGARNTSAEQFYDPNGLRPATFPVVDDPTPKFINGKEIGFTE